MSVSEIPASAGVVKSKKSDKVRVLLDDLDDLDEAIAEVVYAVDECMGRCQCLETANARLRAKIKETV